MPMLLPSSFLWSGTCICSSFCVQVVVVWPSSRPAPTCPALARVRPPRHAVGPHDLTALRNIAFLHCTSSGTRGPPAT